MLFEKYDYDYVINILEQWANENYPEAQFDINDDGQLDLHLNDKICAITIYYPGEKLMFYCQHDGSLKAPSWTVISAWLGVGIAYKPKWPHFKASLEDPTSLSKLKEWIDNGL